MCTINNPLCSQLLLSKIDIPVLKKMLIKEVTKNICYTAIMPNKLDNKVRYLINVIDIAMTFTILKTKLFPKRALRFDKMYKKI